MIDTILNLLRLLAKDPDRAAKRFNTFSSAAGDRLRPWLYGLIGSVIVLLLGAVVLVLLAS